jgi:hypothetical protein
MRDEMDDREVARLLTVEEATVDTAGGLARFRRAAAATGARPYRSNTLRQWRTPLAAAAAVALLVSGLAVSGVADSVFTIFQPKKVAPVTITAGELKGLPDLRQFGTLTVRKQPELRPVADAAAAERESGVRALIPTKLPTVVDPAARWSAGDQVIMDFTFDPAKLAESAARAGATMPPMPASVAGSTLTFTGGPGVVHSYGGTFDPARTESLPPLVIAHGKAPVVTSNGATLDELRAYMLAQPGVSPELADQIRAIGDPGQTLVVPVPLDLASGRKVSVRGTTGVFVGDSTGLGSGVVWVADGLVHVVFGTLTESEILAVADSLR